MACRISVGEARAYFAHPSQQLYGITPDTLPGEPVQYWADGPLCGIFHPSFWPGVWMCHHAAKPEGWGHLNGPARRILDAFARDARPLRIIGWTDAANRHAIAFTRRMGFAEDGRMPVGSTEIVMTGWSPEGGR